MAATGEGQGLYFPNTPTLHQLELLKDELDLKQDRVMLIKMAMKLNPVGNMWCWRRRPDVLKAMDQVHILKPLSELKKDLEATFDSIRFYETMIQFAEAVPYPCQFECAECKHRRAADRQAAVIAAGKGTLACAKHVDTRRRRKGACPGFRAVISSEETGARIGLLIQFRIAADAGVPFADFVAKYD